MRGFPVVALSVLATSLSFAQEAVRPSYNVGDSWTYERTDRTKNAIDLRVEVRTIAKAEAEIRFERKNLDTGRITEFARNGDGNHIEEAGRKWSAPRPDYIWPLAVGKKWGGRFGGMNQSGSGLFSEERECEAVAAESIQVKAGSFQAIKIVCVGNFRNPAPSGTVTLNGRTESTYWYAPETKSSVRIEYRDHSQFGVWNNSVTELVSFGLQK